MNTLLAELSALRAATERQEEAVRRMTEGQQVLQEELQQLLQEELLHWPWCRGAVSEHSEPAPEDTRPKPNASAIIREWSAFARPPATGVAAVPSLVKTLSLPLSLGSKLAANNPSRMKNPFQRAVREPAFEYVCALTIVLHAALLGTYVQYEATVGGDVPWALRAGHFLLTVFFIIEVALKVTVDRVQFFIGSAWKWNMFDCVILVMVFMEATIFLILQKSPGLKSFAKVGEMMRTTRVLRIMKFLRLSPTLQVIVGKIFASTASLFWIFFLIFMSLYVVAVCIAQGAYEYLGDHHSSLLRDSSYAHRELEVHELAIWNYFGSVTKSFYTLFQCITGGEVWGKFADTLYDLHWFYFTLFNVYIALVVFGMLNTMTGIFVDASIMSRQQQREQQAQTERTILNDISRHLREVFRQADGHRAVDLTQEEVGLLVADERMQLYLGHLRVDASDTERLFGLLDVDRKGTIELEEFVQGLMRLKGEASSLDMLQLFKRLDCIDRQLLALGGGRPGRRGSAA